MPNTSQSGNTRYLYRSNDPPCCTVSYVLQSSVFLSQLRDECVGNGRHGRAVSRIWDVQGWSWPGYCWSVRESKLDVSTGKKYVFLLAFSFFPYFDRTFIFDQRMEITVNRCALLFLLLYKTAFQVLQLLSLKVQLCLVCCFEVVLLELLSIPVCFMYVCEDFTSKKQEFNRLDIL